MSCFYFDTYDGERFVPDDKGCDLAEFEEAKAGAVKALTDMAKTVSSAGTIASSRSMSWTKAVIPS
jgi:hypothetical protein